MPHVLLRGIDQSGRQLNGPKLRAWQTCMMVLGRDWARSSNAIGLGLVGVKGRCALPPRAALGLARRPMGPGSPIKSSYSTGMYACCNKPLDPKSQWNYVFDMPFELFVSLVRLWKVCNKPVACYAAPVCCSRHWSFENDTLCRHEALHNCQLLRLTWCAQIVFYLY